jgi:hypothetical protein
MYPHKQANKSSENVAKGRNLERERERERERQSLSQREERD